MRKRIKKEWVFTCVMNTHYGARDGTWTRTSCPTRPSNVRVCRFRHSRILTCFKRGTSVRVTLAVPKIHCSLFASPNSDRCATSAQTPLIVFLAEKLTAPLCFLFPKKPIGLFGDPSEPFIRHRRRSCSVPSNVWGSCSGKTKNQTFRSGHGADVHNTSSSPAIHILYFVL